MSISSIETSDCHRMSEAVWWMETGIIRAEEAFPVELLTRRIVANTGRAIDDAPFRRQHDNRETENV